MKVYCKQCKWKENEDSCEVHKKRDDYYSSNHDVIIKRLNSPIANKNNDCKHYIFDPWSILG